jgi:hypothetical protein
MLIMKVKVSDKSSIKINSGEEENNEMIVVVVVVIWKRKKMKMMIVIMLEEGRMIMFRIVLGRWACVKKGANGERTKERGIRKDGTKKGSGWMDGWLGR